MRLQARLLALILILVFLMAGVFTATNNPSQTGQGTPTLESGSPTVPPVVFPTVPPGGTPVIADYTYFQSSGLLSLPHFIGWDKPDQSAEELDVPGTSMSTSGTVTSKITRAGVTFIDGTDLSVIHAFVEQDPDHKMATVQDLDKYYDKTLLDAAWKNFTGGYKELNRKPDGDLFIINFELYLDTNIYLGRQISRIDQGWLMTLRLVAPNNNPQLLDTLQKAIMPKYHVWLQALAVPVTWPAIADGVSGYVVKYPANWNLTGGKPGSPYIVTGTLGANSYSLDTLVQAGKSVKSEDEARSFVKQIWPKATVQTVGAVKAGEASGFTVSYTNPDLDGNQNSAVAMLINGNGPMYAVNVQSSARGLDLLDASNAAVPAELAQVRSSFFLVPSDALTATLTPTATLPLPPTPAAPAPPTATGAR